PSTRKNSVFHEIIRKRNDFLQNYHYVVTHY
ncbi:MAG: hypothetical protein ACI8RD_007664, partial [Bacillariaceae sp.]